MRPRSRPTYIAERIAYLREVREHKKNSPEGCRCIHCLSQAEFEALIQANLARNTATEQEINF